MDPDRSQFSPFVDPITPVGSVTPYYSSEPNSNRGSSSALPSIVGPHQRYFHSRRVEKGSVQKPWVDKKDPREKWVTIIPLIGIFLGLAVSGYLVYDGFTSVVKHKYCPVLMEDWANGFDTNTWQREVEVGGFGNGQFEYTTNTEENSYVQDGVLYIKPTLQDERLVVQDNVIDLTKMGICTSTIAKNCITATNTTNGTIVNPVKSARINTKNSFSIKYGRIEVVAKLPLGKWLWPAIWMLPSENVYGDWPRSGEIDIMESRGNDHAYPQGGNDIVSGALHWGPDSAHDAWWLTNVKHRALHTTYAAGFNTFGLEWSDKYLFTYVNTRLLQVLYTKFEGKSLWDRGYFPLSSSNGTRYTNPWYESKNLNAPFDQKFYLIMNVAVGGTNGWFEDGIDGKPWVDASPNARKDFWNARNVWAADWSKNDNHAMAVKTVKMWQQCD
ncbi:Beta-glucanase [Orbilia brochopaga]|nr:Beta-glucanase [Drechslerella brochopaga]